MFTYITGIFNWIVGVIVYPFKLLQQWFKKFRMPKWLWVFLELLLVVAGVVLFTFLNYWLNFQQYVGSGPKVLRQLWMPAVFLLVYFSIRLLIFIFRQLPNQLTEFADIDDAMDAGLAALDEARISINDTPLFLVVGLSPEAEASFSQSSLVGSDIRVAGRGMALHWYGNERGIWVTMPGLSALLEQNRLARQSGWSQRAPSIDTSASAYDELGGGQLPAERSENEHQQAFATFGGNPGGVATAQAQEARTSARRLSVDEKELITQRIEYFVSLMKDARHPVCPVNGVLLCLPYEWMANPGLSQLADAVQLDMSVLQQNLGTKCLSLAVFDGIERSPEFVEYINRLDKGQIERRCGCSYPSLTSLEPIDAERVHGWLIQYFERQVFELFQKKLGEQGNGALFRFLDHFRKARGNFLRLLQNAYPRDVKEPFYLGGVYFASVSQVGAHRLPFLEGVLAKLVREHDDVVGWSEETVERDKSLGRWSNFMMGAVVLVTVVAAWLLLTLMFGIRPFWME